MDIRWKPFLAVGAAGLAVGAGVAWATIPDSSGVIHACYKQVGGDLRVIDSGSCKPGEHALSWPGAQKFILRSFTQTVQPSSAHTFSVHCNPGERATGGGYRLYGAITAADQLPLMMAGGSIPIYSGTPEPVDGQQPDGWKAINVLNRDTVARDATVFVVCESP